MKMIPTYVLEQDESFALQRVRHLAGYCLPGRAEREAEVRVLGLLFRKNDTFRGDQYRAAYVTLRNLHRRLMAETDPALWQGVGAFMADERHAQAAEVPRALDALPDPSTLPPDVEGWRHGPRES